MKTDNERMLEGLEEDHRNELTAAAKIILNDLHDNKKNTVTKKVSGISSYINTNARKPVGKLVLKDVDIFTTPYGGIVDYKKLLLRLQEVHHLFEEKPELAVDLFFEVLNDRYFR